MFLPSSFLSPFFFFNPPPPLKYSFETSFCYKEAVVMLQRNYPLKACFVPAGRRDGNKKLKISNFGLMWSIGLIFNF